MRCFRSAGWISVIFLLAGASCSRSSTQQHDPVERVDATTIKVFKDALENLKFAAATTTDFPDQLYLMGKIGITEDRTNVVPARVAGRINQIFFSSGEYVAQGKPLATLFSPDFVAAREEYLQSLKRSKKTRGQEDPSDFANLAKMARKKLETMGLSTEDIDSLATSEAAPRAGADAPDKSSEQLLIRAPRSGVIIAKSAVLGNMVNVGDTLFMIGDMSKVWFLGDLYPEDLPKVHKDQEVRILATGENKVLTGRVSFISPMVDPTSRTIKVRALIDNPDSILKADMYVQGSLILNQAKALLVPTTAVVRTPEGESVFKRVGAKSIESGEGSVAFKKVAVKTGAERQGMTAILDGLKEGEEVVSDGAWLLDAALNSADKAK